MKSGYDINRISGDGYLVLPLSMSKLAKGHGQDPEECYEMIEYFSTKLETYSNDVILLYTIGTYFNSPDIAFEKRKKLNQQALGHSTELRNLIAKKKQFIPNAFHFLPIDYIILNSPHFSDFFTVLQKLEKEDEQFREAIKHDIGDREYIEANINFLLEEVAIAHIIKQRLVRFPRTLVQNDIWRLMVYPGEYIHADAYQWKLKILPQNDKVNPYANGQYDFIQKKFFSCES